MKKKILLLFLSLFLLFLAGIVTTLYLIFHTTRNLDSLVALHKVEIIRQELVINVQTVQANLYTTGTSFGKELDVIADNVLKLDNRVRSCGNCHHDPPVARGITELQELTEQYKDALSYFITSTADPQRIKRLQVVAADIGDTIIAKSQKMALTANENLRKKTIAASEKVRKSKWILVITLVLSFLIALAIAIYLIRIITQPVSELLMATRRIKSGELGATSPYQGQNEFKELIESFNDMSLTLKDSNEKIFAQMTRNQTILQTSTDGFALIDEEGHIVDANPSLCTMTGYTKEELVHMKFTDIELLESQFDPVNLLERIKEARSLVFQADQKTKDGTLVAVEISASFTEMEGRDNFFCFIRDITDRKKMGAERLRVQKLESIGVLAGGIAHDFNNLLTGILGYIDLATRCLDPDDKIQGWLENAKKASVRAQNLTQQLLTFSRGGKPVKQLVPIAPLLKESTRFVLSGSNVRCDYHLPENLWPIEADKGQISQVFQNITLNDAQAMPEGGTITVRAENVTVDEGELPPLRKGEYVKIEFVDEGTGIEKKYIEKIFDPYFTTKQDGNGLGLTICHSIISKHNGRLVVESEFGVGTTFTIYIPALKKESPHESASDKPTEMLGAGKILVMDDEDQVREIVAEMLKYLGYEADLAVDGAEAVALYIKAREVGQPYDALIIDLTIPGGMGGKEAIKKLLQYDPQVKAIVSSGYSNDPIMAEYQKYGFCGVASKPFDIAELSKILHDVLGH